jgi:hypothetical protein
MAKEDVLAIIKRAFGDDTFRLGLMRNFDQVVSNNALQLTAAESQELKKIDWENYAGLGAGGGGEWVHIKTQ